jgi:hypothetical protein
VELDNKEKQARYRANKIQSGDSKRLNMWISKDSFEVLHALSARFSVPKYKIVDAMLHWLEKDPLFQQKIEELKSKPKMLKKKGLDQ